jgi:hypothetical protein
MMYEQRARRDSDGLFVYEYRNDAFDTYRIEGLTLYLMAELINELEAAGEEQADWEAVLERWAWGYRPAYRGELN